MTSILPRHAAASRRSTLVQEHRARKSKPLTSAERLGIDGAVKAQRTGLAINASITLETWSRVGGQLAVVASSSAWWLGDWLLYGSEHFPNRYRQAVEDSGLDYQTLRNYAWVARRFPITRRREKLSFAHHMEVASLPAPDQEVWLDRAVIHGWSKSRLRRSLRDDRRSSESNEIGQASTIRVNATSEQEHRWLAAAKLANRELGDWVASVLDHATQKMLATDRVNKRLGN